MTEINVVTDEQSPKEVIFNELFYSIHGDASNNSLFYLKNNIYEAINKPKEVYENILELIIRDLVLWDYSYSLLNRRIYPFIIIGNKKEGSFTGKVGKETDKVGKEGSFTDGGKEGGKAIKKFKPTIIQPRETSSSIILSFNQPINCYFQNGKKIEQYVLPKFEKANIIGIFVKSYNESNLLYIPIRNGIPELIQFSNLNTDKSTKTILLSIAHNLWKERNYRLSTYIIYAFSLYNQHHFAQVIPINNEIKTNDIIKQIETLTWTRFADNNPHVLSADLFTLGYDKLYFQYNPNTIASKQRIKKILDEQRIHKIFLQKEQTKIAHYVTLIKKKQPSFHLVKEVPTVQDLLNVLSGKERKLVELEIKIETEYQQRLKDNICKHRQILQDLRQSQRLDDIEIQLRNLDPFLVHSKNKELIECKVCHFPIFCPHELAIFRCKLKKLPVDQIRINLNEYYHYENNKYICKICNEDIKEIEDTDIYIPPVPETFNEDIKEQIYSEFIRLKKYIVSTKVPFSAISKTVFALSYHGVELTYRQLLKSKTLSFRDLNRKLSVYIDIYILAILVAYRDVISIDDFNKNTHIKHSDKTRKKDTLELLQIANNIIQKHANIIIRESTDINSAWVQHKLLEIYKTITPTLIAPDDSGPIHHTCDHVINYYLSLTNSVRDPHKKFSIEIAYTTFIPDYNQSLFYSIQTHRIGELLKLNQKQIQLGYIAASAEMFYNLVDVISEVWFISLKQRDTIVGEYTKIYNTIQEKYKKLNYAERAIDIIRRSANMKPTIKRKVTIKQLKIKAPLGRIYDTNGRYHIFEYDMEKKDYLCKICGQWRSEAIKADEKIIQQQIILLGKKNAFFRLFENNCPEGNMHNFAQNETCTKCGLSLDQRNQLDEYYEKYKSHMIKDVTLEFGNKTSTTIINEQKSIKEKYDKLFNDWKFNFHEVNNFATLLKINVKLFMAIGDYDKNSYDKIITGEYIAFIPSNPRNVRTGILKSYIKMVIVEYNQIRFSYTKPNILKSLAALIETSNIPPSQLESLLPSIYTDQYETIEYFQQYKQPQEGVEYCIELLCSMLNSLYNSPTTILKQFTIYIVNKILRGCYLRTKNNYFNFSIVYGEKRETATNLTENFNEFAEVQEEVEDTPFSMDGFDIEEQPNEEGEEQTLIRDINED